MIVISTTWAVPVAFAAAAVVLVRCAYLLWFHPLSKYPGPRLAACSQLWYAKTYTGGAWHEAMADAHRRYGDIVRIAPDELSFVSVQSFKDIYGPPSKTRKLFKKSPLAYGTGKKSIAYELDPEEHKRQQKLFAPAFQPSAVRSQEHVVHEHVDLLVAQLRTKGMSGQVSMDITAWITWVVFDIIGELAFGESFGAVRSGRENDWVTRLHGAVYGMSFAMLLKRLSIIGTLLRWAPKLSKRAADAIKDMERHTALTREKTRRRVEMGNQKGVEDFLAPAIGLMSEDSLVDQAYVFLVAGAETSASALTTAMWFLSRPESASCLQQLQREVRTAFAAYEDMTGDAVAKLPYLNAVLEETMRIVPPAPIGPSRVSPGETVDGVFVPEGMYVSTDLLVMGRDPRNTEDPTAFRPERWLGGGRKPYSQPFIIGPRSCIGVSLAWLEMRLTLAKMVYALDWKLAPEAVGKDWLRECKLLLIWKKPELMLRFTPVRDTV